jgi:hypothetical protein
MSGFGSTSNVRLMVCSIGQAGSGGRTGEFGQAETFETLVRAFFLVGFFVRSGGRFFVL